MSRSENRKRNRIVGVRLTEQELEKLRAMAAVTRTSSVPSFLRAAGLKMRLVSSAAPVPDRDELRRIKIRQGQLADELNKLNSQAPFIPSDERLAGLTTKTLEEVLEMNAMIREALGYDR